MSTQTAVKRVSTYGAGRAALDAALSNHEPFVTSGALRAEKWERDVVTKWDLGELPTEYSNAFMLDHMAGIDYVVWSYSTPIAWVKSDGSKVIPSVRYSRTTSKHQGTLYLL